MRPLVAAVDGTVREIVYDNASGNRVVVQDDEGWFYVYLHLNNDTPGTDDRQATRDQVFAAGLDVDKEDLKRYADFINRKVHDLLIRGAAVAKATSVVASAERIFIYATPVNA